MEQLFIIQGLCYINFYCINPENSALMHAAYFLIDTKATAPNLPQFIHRVFNTL